MEELEKRLPFGFKECFRGADFPAFFGKPEGEGLQRSKNSFLFW